MRRGEKKALSPRMACISWRVRKKSNQRKKSANWFQEKHPTLKRSDKSKNIVFIGANMIITTAILKEKYHDYVTLSILTSLDAIWPQKSILRPTLIWTLDSCLALLKKTYSSLMPLREIGFIIKLARKKRSRGYKKKWSAIANHFLIDLSLV